MGQINPVTIFKGMKDKKMTGSRQHGFMKEKSCLINCLAFYDEMTCLVGEGRAVYVVYFDFSEVFDTVFPNILTQIY